MNIRGWVYLMDNKAMPGLVKIGFSTKDPFLRAPELNSTGVPLDFDVLYDALTINPREIEQQVHRELGYCRVGKEWFRCAPWDAVLRIREVAGGRMICEALHNVKAPDKVPEPESSITRKRNQMMADLARRTQISSQAKAQAYPEGVPPLEHKLLKCPFCRHANKIQNPVPAVVKCSLCMDYFTAPR